MEIVFETRRLYLRRFKETDAELILDLNSDPEVLKYLHEPVLTNKRHALTIIRDIILPQYKLNLGRWAVHLKEKDTFLGWCGLKSRPELNEIDLGYRLKKEYWGHGYAFEAAEKTLNFGFNTLNLDEITGRADVGNLASIRILEKLGMTYMGVQEIDGQPVKSYVAIRKNYLHR